MAQRTQVLVLCDCPHEDVEGDVEATGSVTIAFGRRSRKIDCCDLHRLEIEAAVAPYLDLGMPTDRGAGSGAPFPRSRRSTDAPTPTPPARPTPRDSVDAKELATMGARRWAQSRNIQVNDRGRVPQRITDLYEAELAKAGA